MGTKRKRADEKPIKKPQEKQETTEGKDRAYYLTLSAHQDFLAKRRNNELAEGRLIEADIAIKQCADIVRQVWLLASNLANTIPARCEGATAEKIRAEIVSEMNAAKKAVEEYLAGPA